MICMSYIMKLPVIWDYMTLMWHNCNDLSTLFMLYWVSYSSDVWTMLFEAVSSALIIFFSATKQLNVWYFLSVGPSVYLSVCPSVRPSVRPSVTPFSLCCHNRIIMKFSGVITNGQGKVHAKGHGQRSKVKVIEVTTQLNFFRTVTPVWIHIWWWNNVYIIAWCCLEEVSNCFSRSSIKFQGHTALKIGEFDPDLSFPDCNSSLNSPMATKWCTKLEVTEKRCPIVFQGHTSNFKVTRL